jgi:hypothetical protein
MAPPAPQKSAAAHLHTCRDQRAVCHDRSHEQYPLRVNKGPGTCTEDEWCGSIFSHVWTRVDHLCVTAHASVVPKSREMRVPVCMLHRRAVPSMEEDAATEQSGEKAAKMAASSWPIRLNMGRTITLSAPAWILATCSSLVPLEVLLRTECACTRVCQAERIGGL